MHETEIITINRKYESFRLKDKTKEKFLLHSILEQGIREPLKCIEKQGAEQPYILLDGFKRLRCSEKLRISVVPVTSLGTNEVSSILHFIRLCTEGNLSTLEQSQFVDELHNHYGLTVSEISHRLERSKAWVSVRLGIVDEMSPVLRDEVFSDRFPVRCYMYTLRQFTRVNSIPKKEIDSFVKSVSGKGLSTRDIERLSYAYFRGGNQLRSQIEKGNINWTLRQLHNQELSSHAPADLTEAEWAVIRDLELAQKYISRILFGLTHKELVSEAFHSQALLLIKGLLDMVERFKSQIRSFYDSRTQTKNNQNVV